MKKILTSLSVIQFCLIAMLQGQSFTYHSNSPFGIQISKQDSTRAAQKLAFYDYDNDGDLDLYLTGVDYLEGFDSWSQVHFFLEIQENIGTPQSPLFGERFELYESFPMPVGYFFPAPGDLDDDGDVDFIVAAEIDETGNGKLKMYINSGNQGPNQFNVSPVPAINLQDFVPESFFSPELVDLDQDGDLDLMNSGIDPAFAVEDGPDIPQFYYARNTGSNKDPIFEGWYPDAYGITPDQHGEILTSGDIDNDGDVDFLGTMMTIPGDSISRVVVHLNTPGANEKPAFHTPLYSPFGLPTLYGESQFAFPELVDIDTDGDLDIFVFHADANGTVLQYYQNNFCSGGINDLLISLCYGDVFSIDGIDYDEPGEYSATLTASNGCDSIINLTLVVIQLDIAVTVNENILTSNQTFASYQWFNCDTGEDIAGATGQSFIATSTGNYAVRIMDGNGCTAVSACNSVVIISTTNPDFSNQISLHPNPADDLLHVLNISPYPISGLSVINHYGQKLYENTEKGNGPVDVSQLDPGMYYLIIEFNSSFIMKKFIIL